MTTESPDGGWGWVVVLGAFVSNSLVAALYFAYGVFTQSWMNEFDASAGMVSLVGCTASVFISTSAPLASFLINKWGCRVTSMIGASLVTSGMLMCSLASSLSQVLIFYGLIGGVGLGLCYVPTVICVSLYFNKRRAIALGISSSGIGAGSFLFPIILELLQAEYTWRGAMLILSGIMANGIASAAVIFPLHPPAPKTEKKSSKLKKILGRPPTAESINEYQDYKLDDNPENHLSDETSDDSKSMTSSYCKECDELDNPITDEKETFLEQSKQIFCNPLFYVMIINNVTMFLSMMLVFAITPLRATIELGFTREQGAWLVSVIGLATLIGRFTWGALSSFVTSLSPIVLFIALRSIASLLTLLSPLATSFVMQLMYCSLVGLSYGLWSLYPIVVAKLFGDRSLNVAFGYLEVFDGIGALLGPAFGGFIYDAIKSFTIPFVFSGVVMATGTIVLSVGYFVFARKRTLTCPASPSQSVG